MRFPDCYFFAAAILEVKRDVVQVREGGQKKTRRTGSSRLRNSGQRRNSGYLNPFPEVGHLSNLACACVFVSFFVVFVLPGGWGTKKDSANGIRSFAKFWLMENLR